MMIQEWVSLEFAQLEPQRYLVKEVSIHLRKHASLIVFNFFFFFMKIRVRILRVGIQQLEYESHEISFVERFQQFFLVIPLSQRFISHEIKYSKVCNKSFSFFIDIKLVPEKEESTGGILEDFESFPSSKKARKSFFQPGVFLTVFAMVDKKQYSGGTGIVLSSIRLLRRGWSAIAQLQPSKAVLGRSRQLPLARCNASRAAYLTCNFCPCQD